MKMCLNVYDKFVVVVVYSLSTTPLAILVALPQPFVIHIQTHFHTVPPNQSNALASDVSASELWDDKLV